MGDIPEIGHSSMLEAVYLTILCLNGRLSWVVGFMDVIMGDIPGEMRPSIFQLFFSVTRVNTEK